MQRSATLALLCVLASVLSLQEGLAAEGGDERHSPRERTEPLPHNQERPPGPALSPAEAIAKMRVPPGFHVELVAAEPDLVNPIAMTFDERGRIWVTESVEYPRKSPGVGRDRIKILEDTDGDGKADKITVFADGLNIPSGIAVGHGGVWVANAPDILFLQDTDGDGKADRREVVVTGFGRDDTHELPNSLTWGPDGWLYGLNGVFNRSHVRSDGKDFQFTCAMFRIHPRTREFQIFCEGTSNPWGIAWDSLGSAFVSACVIDHLWHLTETGYYHRQGGPYPPFAWKIGSIVNHAHQKAAYCGIHFFDSDAYPKEYRERLYMGNIHGGCVNVDVLSRDGSTYFARPAPDFLTGNDAWFMPVSQKTGPDGSLYILDWYDRYHCYQDAGRDPRGIDRLKGRLYRVRYQQTPRVWGFDLARETDDQLLARLDTAPNDYFRQTIVRLLAERRDAATTPKLAQRVLDDNRAHKVRLHALWALLGSGHVSDGFLAQLLANREPALRAWGVRAAGNAGRVSPRVQNFVRAAAHDPSADVRLQAAIAARKIEGIDPVLLLVDVLANTVDDKLIPHIVWNNLQPIVETRGRDIVDALRNRGGVRAPALSEFLPRLLDRILAARTIEGPVLRDLLRLAVHEATPQGTSRCLEILAARVQTGELAGPRLKAVHAAVEPILDSVLSQDRENPLHAEAAFLAASWKEPGGIAATRGYLLDRAAPESRRTAALDALIASGDRDVLPAVDAILSSDSKNSLPLRAHAIASLGKIDSPRVAEMILAHYSQLDPALAPVAIELLTQRSSWSKSLLAAIGAGHVPTQSLNLSHVRKLLASRDKELVAQVREKWGTVREQRNPQRELVIKQMRRLIAQNRGHAAEGEKVFKRICAQCHKIHGEGADVGPDITRSGRSSFEQLLSNVFDPNLVIGAGYRAMIVVAKDGRVLTGLLTEESSRRIVLKIQGGKTEIIPRSDVETSRVSNISLMPEQIENQLKPQEIVDLFAYLSYDRPPGDPAARRLFGSQ